MSTPPTLVLVGPTATGKSGLALAVAEAVAGVELVSADSMQVYRGMDIGTAKPTAAERARVAHHLVDVCDPSEDFSVARFQADARAAIAAIHGRGGRAVVVGGTGLYVRALVDGLSIPGHWPAVRAELEAAASAGPDAVAALHRRLAALDPAAAARMEPGNARRIVRALEVTLGSGRPFSSYGPGLTAYPPAPGYELVGLALGRDELALRIARRFDAMVAAGLVEEVRGLAARYGPALSRTARQALGYRELLRHVEDGAPLAECVAEAVRRTRSFAVRQERWFRRDPRIRWLDATAPPGALVAEVLRAVAP